MRPFDVYKLYIALKLHFTTEHYDFTKMGGKTTATHRSFENRSDKWIFEQLAKKYTTKYIFDLFLSMFVYHENAYAGELVFDYDKSKEIYNKWKSRVSKLSLRLNDDCLYIKERSVKNKIAIVDMFKPSSKYGDLPIVIQMFLKGKISIETLLIFDKVFNFIEKCDTIINDDDIWKSLSLRIRKYGSFLKVEKKLPRLKTIIKQNFLEDE